VEIGERSRVRVSAAHESAEVLIHRLHSGMLAVKG